MTWIPSIDPDSGPIYRRIADALAREVASGSLQSGQKLPTHRELAQRLGVDLTTVTRAYNEAGERGLIVSEGRRGTFVRGRAMNNDDPSATGAEVATGMNMPPEPEDGELRKRMADGIVTLLSDRLAPMHYQPVGGTDEQRLSATNFISEMIPETSPDQVLVSAGAQHGLHAIMSLLLKRGDKVGSGCFSYPGLLAVARRTGAEVIPLAMDAEGITPEGIESAARQHQLRALYIVPTNDNPTTATMSVGRRRKIVQLARRFGFEIIEDDAYGRLPSKPLPPLTSFAQDCSWHITSLSKLLSPSLRVGFVRAPSVRGAHELAGLMHESCVMAPPLMAALVTRWLGDGTFPRLLASVRAESVARMAEAGTILRSCGARFHTEGYHVWLPLGDDLNADHIARQALAMGLPAVPSTSFTVGAGSSLQALRISLGGSAGRVRVARELRRLDALISQTSRAKGELI